ncbi:MAG: hypothetical protein WDN06_18070 [Asticcacaulis sp.]
MDRSRRYGQDYQNTLITTGEYDEVTLDCHTTTRHGVSGPARLEIFRDLTMCEKPGTYVGGVGVVAAWRRGGVAAWRRGGGSWPQPPEPPRRRLNLPENARPRRPR